MENNQPQTPPSEPAATPQPTPAEPKPRSHFNPLVLVGILAVICVVVVVVLILTSPKKDATETGPETEIDPTSAQTKVRTQEEIEADFKRTDQYSDVAATVRQYISAHNDELPPLGDFEYYKELGKTLPTDPSGKPYKIEVKACESDADDCSIDSELEAGTIYIVLNTVCIPDSDPASLAPSSEALDFTVYGFLSNTPYCAAGNN